MQHGVAGSQAEAGRVALTAGVDVDMQSGIYVDALAALVRSNRIPMTVVDTAVMRVLRAKLYLGLFRDPYRPRLQPAAPELRALARRAANESIVLLKNDRVGGRGAACCAPTDGTILPLAKTATIAVIGRSPTTRTSRSVPGTRKAGAGCRDGTARNQESGDRIAVVYVQGAGVEDTATAGFTAAVAAAKRANVAVLSWVSAAT